MANIAKSIMLEKILDFIIGSGFGFVFPCLKYDQISKFPNLDDNHEKIEVVSKDS